MNQAGQTCERCQATGDIIEKAFNKLKNSLAGLDIEVCLEKESLDFSLFSREPLESNRMWIGEKPLEEWLGADVGRSRCCDVCGDSECRTLQIGVNTFETIPEGLIIRAGLLAAAELFS